MDTPRGFHLFPAFWSHQLVHLLMQSARTAGWKLQPAEQRPTESGPLCFKPVSLEMPEQRHIANPSHISALNSAHLIRSLIPARDHRQIELDADAFPEVVSGEDL